LRKSSKALDSLRELRVSAVHTADFRFNIGIINLAN
jgi:hypothetical protein